MPVKTSSIIPPNALAASRWRNWSAVRNLNPLTLSRWMDAWDAGHLAPLARLFTHIEDRDDILGAVAAKRKADVASCDWEIVQADDSDAAKRHAETLRAAYNNLTATNALDLDESGSIDLLLEQMADAIGSKYSVHEILWQKRASGLLTAEFRNVPVWMFERSTGRLTYQPSGQADPGIALSEGEWLRCVAPRALHRAGAIAYLYKQYGMADWLQYCERNGMPAFLAHTSASPTSDEWTAAEEAVGALAAEFAAVVSESTRMEVLDLKGAGQIPYPALVERMDRALTVIWRGSDLGTLAKGDGVGATNQAGESAILLNRDCKLLAGALNTQFGRHVIEYAFGARTQPLAYLTIRPPATDQRAADSAAFEAAQRLGARLSLRDIRESLRLATPADAADTLPAHRFPINTLNPKV